jgi:hypothetical protein
MRRLLRSRFLAAAVSAILAVVAGVLRAGEPGCGPFSDFTDPNFCPFVLEIFYQGITTGTTPTTYSPNQGVTRLQMAAFLSRTVDRALQKASRRTVLNQLWTSQGPSVLRHTTIGLTPSFVRFDGADLWVSNFGEGTVSRVRAGDGRVLGTWTGLTAPADNIATGSSVCVADINAHALYRIDPGLPPGAATAVSTALGNLPTGLAFDGRRIWSTNQSGSVSYVTPGTVLPWTVTTVSAGFGVTLGALYDGSNVWVTDSMANKLHKLDADGAILQSVTIGSSPRYPLYDGTNIWVPSVGGAVVVVRPSTGAILATLTNAGLTTPYAAAFDGQRVLVTNASGGVVTIWKAADPTLLQIVQTGGRNGIVASDGVNFWLSFPDLNTVARF